MSVISSYPFNNNGSSVSSDLPTGRRAFPRLRLSIPARLVTLKDTRRCILFNLSRNGAQIGLADPLDKDEGGFLQFAGMEQFGVAVRASLGPSGGINGLEFEEPLSEEEVLAVRSYSERFADDERSAMLREVKAWVTGSV